MTDAPTLEVGLFGNASFPMVSLQGDAAQRVRDMLRSHASWDEVEQPWNPMGRYAGVEIRNASPAQELLVAWSGRLVDRAHRRAWDAPGLEEDLLSLLVDKERSLDVRAAIGWRRWRRLQRYRSR